MSVNSLSGSSLHRQEFIDKNHTIEQKIDEWYTSNFENISLEHYQELKKYLLSIDRDTENFELFSVFPIKSLPDIFEEFPNLKSIRLRCALEIIPESLGKLSQLETLDLSLNEITSVPEFLGNLSQLQSLDLSSNQITHIPKSLGTLVQLASLLLRRNQIIHVPESFETLVRLRVLDLSSNQIESLPESLGQLSQLEMLFLGGNQITGIPESLGSLSRLESLDLSSNQIKSLPESLGSLSRLETLNLFSNQIRRLPKSLGNLSRIKDLYLYDNLILRFDFNFVSSVRIYMHKNPHTMLLKLREICQITFNSFSHCEKLLDKVLNDPKEDLLKSLNDWFYKIEEETKVAPNLKKDFYSVLISIFELASQDDKFYELFSLAIEEEGTTCGDRAALSFIYLEMTFQIYRLSLDDVQNIIKLLKSFRCIKLIEECAHGKVKEIEKGIREHNDSSNDPIPEFKEDIEIYLQYLLELRNVHKNPFIINEMTNPNYGGYIKGEDLEAAKQYVLSSINNKEAFIDFLILQDKWLEVLKKKYPKKFNELKQNYENSNSRNPEEEYQNNLKSLSKKLLKAQEDLTETTSTQRPRISIRELKSLGLLPKRRRVGKKELEGLGINPLTFSKV